MGISWIRPMTWPAVHTCKRGQQCSPTWGLMPEARTHAKVGIAIDEDLLAALAADEGRHGREVAVGVGGLDLEGLLDDLVLVEACGVAPLPEDEGRVRLLGADDLFLDVAVDGRLDGAHEASAHVDAACAEAEGGGEAVAVCEATGRDKGDAIEGLAGAGEEDEVCNVGLADVAGALEAVDGEEVDAELDGGDGVTDGGALVEDGDAGALELGDDGAGGVASRLDNCDALVDDGLGVCAVVGGHEGGEEGQVDGEGVLSQGLAAADLGAKLVG